MTDPGAAGEELTYELRYGNPGGSTATGAELHLPLPAGTTLVAATGGGSEMSGDVVWSLGTIGAGAGGRQRVTVEVDEAATDNSFLLVDTATLSATVSSVERQSEAMAAPAPRTRGRVGRSAGSLVYRHGEALYNFQGVLAEQDKFHPQRVPRYLAWSGVLRPRRGATAGALSSAGPRARCRRASARRATP